MSKYIKESDINMLYSIIKRFPSERCEANKNDLKSTACNKCKMQNVCSIISLIGDFLNSDEDDTYNLIKAISEDY